MEGSGMICWRSAAPGLPEAETRPDAGGCDAPPCTTRLYAPWCRARFSGCQSCATHRACTQSQPACTHPLFDSTSGPIPVRCYSRPPPPSSPPTAAVPATAASAVCDSCHPPPTRYGLSLLSPLGLLGHCVLPPPNPCWQVISPAPLQWRVTPSDEVSSHEVCSSVYM